MKPTFTLSQPNQERVKQSIQEAKESALKTPRLLYAGRAGQVLDRVPGFVCDTSRSRLGAGSTAFEVAKRAFRRWVHFDLGWARVANPETEIAVGETIAVEMRTLGLWSVNLSRIVDVVDTPQRFGFVYSTTQLHVERGEELFSLRIDEAAGEVWYEIEAYSRPVHILARLGYPVARALQHRFVRHSHEQMRLCTE